MPEELRPTAAIAMQESSNIGGYVFIKLWDSYDVLEVAGIKVALTPSERDALKARLLDIANHRALVGRGEAR